MSKRVIGQFFEELKFAIERAEELKRLWKGRMAWYVVEAPNGCFVISEHQARVCFPYLTELKSYKNRRYDKSIIGKKK